MATDPQRPDRTVVLTRPRIAAAASAVLGLGVLGGGAAAAGWERFIEDEAWEERAQVEGALHRAVEDMANGGDLAEGSEFRVVEIQGTVGEHNSPWHITYTAVIERIEPEG